MIIPHSDKNHIGKARKTNKLYKNTSNKKDNIIIESNSTWASCRFAVDYWGLNARSQAINFPIPDIQDALDSVCTAQSKVFSVMDLANHHWQIPLHPETADRTAFITHDGCYQFTRVPYGIENGIQNGSMAFQMLMSRVLRNINFKFVLVLFIDDILCHSSTFEQHLEHLSAIFQRLRNSNLKLNRFSLSTNRKARILMFLHFLLTI